MPILGLTSGVIVKISKMQFESLMKQRTPLIEGMMVEIYDENKKPIGKVRQNAIEFVAPDDSPCFIPMKPNVGISEAKKAINTPEQEMKAEVLDRPPSTGTPGGEYKPFVTPKKLPGRPKSK